MSAQHMTDWAETIKKVQLDDLMESYGHTVSMVGPRSFVVCPSGSHEDAKPSCVLNLDAKRQNFYCFSCGFKGDALALIAHENGLDITKEAVKAFAILQKIVNGHQVIPSTKPKPGPARMKAGPSSMPAAVQAKHVNDFLSAVDSVCGTAASTGASAYFDSRRLPGEQAVKIGLCRRVRYDQWRQVGKRLGLEIGHPMMDAGLARVDRHGQVVPLWWDDTVLGVCVVDCAPMYLWGRRVDPGVGAMCDVRYVNQSTCGGATRQPFYLDRAAAVARDRRMRMRVVEGPITAIGSMLARSCALPTCAVLGRISGDGVVDALRNRCAGLELEISYDYDHSPSKREKGRLMANDVADGLSLYGIKAKASTVAHYGFPCKDWADAAMRTM